MSHNTAYKVQEIVLLNFERMHYFFHPNGVTNKSFLDRLKREINGKL